LARAAIAEHGYRLIEHCPVLLIEHGVDQAGSDLKWDILDRRRIRGRFPNLIYSLDLRQHFDRPREARHLAQVPGKPFGQPDRPYRSDGDL
jgi:hypothetical protein